MFDTDGFQCDLWCMWAYGRVKPGVSFDRGGLSGCCTGNSPMTMSVFFRWGFGCKKSLTDWTNVIHFNASWKCVKLYKGKCSTLGSRSLMGSVITRHVQIRLLGLLWDDHISSSWPGADELLRCGRLKALEKCRWDRRQQTCVSPHDCEQTCKISEYIDSSTVQMM